MNDDEDERTGGGSGARRLLALVRDSPDLVGIIGADGGVEYLSPGFVTLFTGRDAEIVATVRPLDHIHRRDLRALATAFDDSLAQPGVAVAVRLRARRRDRAWRVLACTFTNHLDDPDVHGIVLRASDITEQAGAEREIEQRLAVARALGATSRDLLDGRDDLRTCVARALQRVGALADATRAMFVMLDDDGRVDALRSAEWTAIGVEPLLGRFAGARPTAVSLRPERAHGAISVRTLALPDDERELLEALGVDGVTVVAVARDERIVGYLALHFVGAHTCPPLVADGVEDLAAIIGAAMAKEDAEAARARSDARLERFLEASWDSIIVIDSTTRLIYATPSLRQLLGHEPDALLGTPMIELVHPDDLAAAAEALDNNLHFVSEGSPAELRVRHADGHWIDVEIVGRNRIDDPAVQGIVVNVRDVTERKAIEATLRAAEDRFEEVFEHAPNGMALADSDGRFFRVNPALCSMLAHTADDLLGRSFAELTHPDDLVRNKHLHGEMFDGRRPEYVIEKRYRRATGDYVWCRVHVSLVRDAEGHPLYSIGQIHDITEERTAAEILEYEARYDALTGLATRKLFFEQLERAIANTRRRGGLVAVLFIDLDHFKTVNDTMGHAAGDELLAAVAQRMRSVLRIGDFACRFGGDEFMVLCTDLESPADVAEVAERTRAAIEQPFMIRGTEVFIGASIGIALADDAADASALLSQADSAAYRAKERGRNRFEVFDDDLRAAITERLETEHALRRALEHDELQLLYQPIVGTETGAIDGFEALLRWARPGHGLVTPGAFLAVAEDRGLIVPIGRMILERACRQLVAWEGRGPGGTTPTIAVNLSARQLTHPEFVEQVAEVLAETGADPRSLCFELTETAVMDDAATAIATLHRLRAMGVDLGIDDFGTGYSSLSYLRRLPASVVKIDRSFVMELGATSHGSTIVASVIHLAHALGMRVVAEGVETIEHVAALVTMGCDQMQGYYFSPPVAAGTATELLGAGSFAR